MPAEPVKPVSQASRADGFRHVFALVLVGARHDEAVEPHLLQLGAEQGGALGAFGRIGGFGEGLEHGGGH